MTDDGRTDDRRREVDARRPARTGGRAGVPLAVATHPDGAVIFEVHVQPRASRDRLGPVHDGRLKVALTAPPVEGAANATLCCLLARGLGLPRSSVEVLRGQSGRRKTMRIRGSSAAAVRALAEPAPADRPKRGSR
jgi:uncharacterized protein (TIGR00251 family)